MHLNVDVIYFSTTKVLSFWLIFSGFVKRYQQLAWNFPEIMKIILIWANLFTLKFHVWWETNLEFWVFRGLFLPQNTILYFPTTQSCNQSIKTFLAILASILESMSRSHLTAYWLFSFPIEIFNETIQCGSCWRCGHVGRSEAGSRLRRMCTISAIVLLYLSPYCFPEIDHIFCCLTPHCQQILDIYSVKGILDYYIFNLIGVDLDCLF